MRLTQGTPGAFGQRRCHRSKSVLSSAVARVEAEIVTKKNGPAVWMQSFCSLARVCTLVCVYGRYSEPVQGKALGKDEEEQQEGRVWR